MKKKQLVVLQVICSQMDFYSLLQSHFFKLSVCKERICKPFFFFFFYHSLYDEPSSRQFSASASSFHRLFTPPFSAETIEGRRGNNGRFGWMSKRREGRGGKGREGDLYRTHIQANTQTEGGW